MLVAAALLVGSVVPAQTAVNGKLRLSVGAPIPTALISFSVAFVCALVLAVTASGGLFGLSAAAGQPWWVWIGGAMGVIFLTGNVILFPKIGSVETVVIPIIGMVIMALAIDQFGLFGSPRNEVGLLRLLGAAVVVAGVLLVHVVGRPGTKSTTTGGDADARSAWLWRAFGVFMGMCSASQTAANGYLGTVLGSSLQAGAVNLAVGSILLLLLSLFLPASRKALLSGVSPGPWWMWLGGVFGAAFVVGAATLAPILGTGTTVIAQLAGTIICGQIIEAGGFFGSPKSRIRAPRVVGLALVFLGVVMVRLL